MLSVINTKLLIIVLAALAAIGSAVVYQRHESAKATAIPSATAKGGRGAEGSR